MSLVSRSGLARVPDDHGVPEEILELPEKSHFDQVRVGRVSGSGELAANTVRGSISPYLLIARDGGFWSCRIHRK